MVLTEYQSVIQNHLDIHAKHEIYHYVKCHFSVKYILADCFQIFFYHKMDLWTRLRFFFIKRQEIHISIARFHQSGELISSGNFIWPLHPRYWYNEQKGMKTIIYFLRKALSYIFFITFLLAIAKWQIKAQLFLFWKYVINQWNIPQMRFELCVNQ